MAGEHGLRSFWPSKPSLELVAPFAGRFFQNAPSNFRNGQLTESTGLSPAKIATIAAGQRPVDLSGDEASAYDVAAALAGGKQLPGSTY